MSIGKFNYFQMWFIVYQCMLCGVYVGASASSTTQVMLCSHAYSILLLEQCVFGQIIIVCNIMGDIIMSRNTLRMRAHVVRQHRLVSKCVVLLFFVIMISGLQTFYFCSFWLLYERYHSGYNIDNHSNNNNSNKKRMHRHLQIHSIYDVHIARLILMKYKTLGAMPHITHTHSHNKLVC